MAIKMVKYQDDECFGLHHDEIEQCKECWIKAACLVAYKNRDK
jgi:hypothetical protein